MVEEEISLSGAEKAFGVLSGALLGSAVGFYLLHGIPPLPAIEIALYGLGIGLGGAEQFIKRERSEWNQRFVDGA